MSLMITESGHKTVLLEQAVTALLGREGHQQEDGFGKVYIDATFGRGGHSQKILSALHARDRLIAIDRDPEAVAVGRSWSDPRFEMVHGSFGELAEMVRERALWGAVAGVLFDLGVSSPQLDQSQRGFSFQSDGPLDMRMDNSRGVSAKEWLATVEEDELARVLKEYGEERFAKRIARAIVNRRQHEPLTTTKQLADLIVGTVPSKKQWKHPATRSFQAIRMVINRELQELESGLEASLEFLQASGRIVCISFHSLEDRIVKRFFQKQQQGDPFPKDMPVLEDQLKRRLEKVGKALKPTEEEVEGNVRARSAVMRVAEKL